GLATYRASVWILANGKLPVFSQGANPTSGPERTVDVPGTQTFLAVKPLAAGPDGRLWVATDAGLKMVTGKTVTTFTTANSPLPADEVRALAVEPATGAVWITTSAGLARFDAGYVAPPPPQLASLRIRVYPNPATLTNLGIGLRLNGEATSYSGTIHDLSGRRVRRFVAANGAVFWDGRDDQGRLVKPGIYFVRA